MPHASLGFEQQNNMPSICGGKFARFVSFRSQATSDKEAVRQSIAGSIVDFPAPAFETVLSRPIACCNNQQTEHIKFRPTLNPTTSQF